MLPPLLDLLAVERAKPDSDDNLFISKINPRPQGNRNPIAYGGCVTAYAVQAASLTVPPTFHIYSILGTFLGPTRVSSKVYCRVTRTRDTRTFATRRVLAFQIEPDGSERSCMDCSVDFQVEEPALFTYSAAPPVSYQYGPNDPNHAMLIHELKTRAVNEGRTTRAAAEAHSTMFDMMEAYFDWTLCLDGVSAQNVMGLVADAATTQDGLAIWDKSTTEWFRTKEDVPKSSSSHATSIAALAFLMDGGLSFLPLHHDHKSFADAGACSTLEFALRVLDPSVNMNAWLLRERKTVAAAGSRTYSEGRLWDEKGRMVAIATHTSILRPLAKGTASGKSKI